MAEDISGVLQEISELLKRLSEENEAAFQRQGEIESRIGIGHDGRADAQSESESLLTQLEALRDMTMDGLAQRSEDKAFRERLLRTLEKQNLLLEALIARIKDRPS